MKSHLPEEKLLRLIREKSASRSVPAIAKASLRPARADGKFFIGLFYGILILILAGLVSFLAYRIFAEPQPAHRLLTQTEEKSLEDPDALPVLAKEILPFDHYQEQLTKRDLFERPLAQVAANASVDLTKRYKLVGIVLGDVPEAIVEDLTNKTTMFVHEGERLESVQVKTIEEGRIVFLQEGLEIELKQ